MLPMYTYIPAIRHGVNEQQALETLEDQLSQNSSGQLNPDKIKPLLEIVEDSHTNNIPHYTSAFNEVFVDFPRYLVDRDNKHEDDVADLITRYSNSPVNFHTRNSNHNYTPVVSGHIDPIDHSNFTAYIQDLQSTFDRICVRLFVPIDPYTSAEENGIRDIIDELRDQDAVLVDVVDVDQLSTGIRPNIDFVRGEVNGPDFYIFDLFEPRDEVNYNYGLVMGKYAGVDAVGDFVIEPRFPSDIPDAAFQNIPKRMRQYESDLHAVDTTEDSDHYVNAVETMIANGDIDRNHCAACESIIDEYNNVQNDPGRTDLGAGFVKRMRMNHYTYSILDEEFSDMDSASDAEDFDQNGYDDIV